MSLLDLRMQLWHTLIIERNFAAHQDIENDAETPDIDLWSGVLLRLQQLWSGEIQATTERLQLASGRKKIAQTKIDDLNVASLADKDVLDLQIMMNDAVPMAVVQRTGDLTGELAGLFLLETSVRDDVVEHLSSVYEFEEHVPMVICAHDIPHATNVGVVEQTDNSSFPCSSNFLGVVGSFAVGSALVVVLGLSRHYLHSHLRRVSACCRPPTLLKTRWPYIPAHQFRCVSPA